MSEEDLLEKQYNLYPYPPIPVGEMEDEVLYSTNYEFVNYICTKKYKTQNNIKILDAGCGTGYSTLKLASQNPDAKIVAIDISKSSLKIAKERLKRANLYSDRIIFYNANLEDLSFINDKFDYIVSTGVLHHLKDPEKGLKNLKELLLPEGIIYIMLYSEYGRYPLKLFRKLIDIIRKDKNDFEEGIKVGKELLNILPDKNIIKIDYINNYNSYLSKFGKEFADSKSQFIDAYLNAREKTYTIHELIDLLEKNNLKLIKFLDESIRNRSFLFSKSALLSEYTKNLSEKDIYKISELFFPERNFAFFCTHDSFNINNQKKEIKKFKLSKFNKKDNNILMSATGKGIQLLGMYKYIYEEIEKENDFYDICQNVSYKFYCDINKAETIVKNFIYEMENCDLIYIL
jgi:ubiquinone/menaquinone biosynthesis C-methylase UbiE